MSCLHPVLTKGVEWEMMERNPFERSKCEQPLIHALSPGTDGRGYADLIDVSPNPVSTLYADRLSLEML